LPEHAAGFAFGFHLCDNSIEIDGNELFHGPTIALSKAAEQQAMPHSSRAFKMRDRSLGRGDIEKAEG
jgi:hypothetical protein